MRRLLTVFSLSLFCMACGSNEDLPATEDIVNNKIENVIPRQYLDTLTRLGLTANKGINPPNVEGVYFVRPHLLDAGNVPGDEPGRRFPDVELRLSAQRNPAFSIVFTGSNFVSRNDTSMVTVIAGQGNDFSVYARMKAMDGDDYAIFGVVISGTRIGETLRDLRIGIINIDDTHGGGRFMRQGQGRVGYDADDITAREK